MRIYSRIEFIKLANQKHNFKFDYTKVIYINSRTKIIIVCPTHGQFEQKPCVHLTGRGCRQCYDTSLFLNTEVFISRSLEKYPTLFSYSKTFYVNMITPIIITCNKHGDFETTPQTHLRKFGACPICHNIRMKKNLTLTHEEFMERLFAIYGSAEDYSKTHYTKNDIKVTMICKKHGEYKKLPAQLLNGGGCQKCKESRGEKAVRVVLEKLNIEFVGQYKISECKNKLPLPFDFGLLRDGNLIALIEYQGIQHYEPSRFSSSCTVTQAKIQLASTQKFDNIKMQYCLTNNIPLLTIPYWHKDDIPVIISEFIPPMLLKTNNLESS